MRILTFWSLTLLVIFVGTSALIASWVVPAPLTGPLASLPDSQPLQNRAALLGIGLTAIAITYRQAWLSWSTRSSKQS